MYEFDVVRMKRCCNEMRQAVSKMQNTMQSLENLLMDIPGNWQGEAEQIYETKIIYVRYRYALLIDFFEHYIDILEKSAEFCSEKENDIFIRLSNV
jgi:uncharacterized protein YukE